ncbi:MAG: DivIVA domain-containing protein, partial [Acidimicrobiales bacterium]
MASAPPPLDPVTADDVLTVQFTHIRKGGYAQQEVDAFLDRIAATMDSDQSLVVDGAMTADDIRMVQFSQMRRGGYDTREVDMFLDRVVSVLGQGPPSAAVPASQEPDANLAPSEPVPDPTPEPLPEPSPVEVAPTPIASAPEPVEVPVAAEDPVPATDPAPAPPPSG